MKRTLYGLAITGFAVAMWLMAQPAGDPLVDGFRYVEVASVADDLVTEAEDARYLSRKGNGPFQITAAPMRLETKAA